MRILVVEDDPGTRTVVKSVLSSDLDARIDAAETGQDAIEHLDRELVDVVILDHELPDVNGLTVLEHVQRTCPGAVVIYLTGAGDEQVARRALEQGAVDYLTKGLDTYRELPKIVYDAFHEWRGDRPTVEAHTRGDPRDAGQTDLERPVDEALSDSPLDGLIVCSPDGGVLHSSLAQVDTGAILAGDAGTWVQAAEMLAEDAGLELGTTFGTLRGDPGTIALLAAPETVVLVGIYESPVEPSQGLEDLRSVLDRLREDPSIASQQSPDDRDPGDDPRRDRDPTRSGPDPTPGS